MGTLDDAIREHLELKRRGGAADDEVTRLENEAFGAARRQPPPAAISEPTDQPDVSELPPPPAAQPVAERAPEPVTAAAEESWLDDEPAEPELPAASTQSTSEFTAHEVSDAAGGAPTEDYVAPDEEGDDLLEETPEFLQETPEHDRLWFEQKPPRDFDV